MTYLPEPLLESAAAHHGLIRRDQLTAAAITRSRRRSLMAARVIERVSGEVFRIPGAPVTPSQQLLAACWTLDGVASHRTAAALHGWRNFEVGDPPEIMIHEPTHRRTPLARLRTVSALDPRDIMVIDAIPVTTPGRTLLSLAGIAGLRKDGKEISEWVVEDAFDEALSNRQTDDATLRDMLERNRRSGRPGVALIEKLLDARRDGVITESHLERRTLEILAAAQLPEPVCQARIAPTADLVARVDFLYPDQQVVIEVSGLRWHRSARQFERDTARRRELTALGLQVYEFTYRQITRQPGLLVGLVRSIHQASAA